MVELGDLETLEELLGYSEVDRVRHAVASPFERGFPNDYREWAKGYNTLILCHELTVFNYFDQVSGVDSEIVEMMKVYEGPRSGFTFEIDGFYDTQGVLREFRGSLPLYPASGGLLLWGETDSGHAYFWDTSRDDPSQWETVVTDNAGYWQRFNFGFASFLVRLIGHRLNLPAEQSSLWPWLPAYQECIGREGDELILHTPDRWRSYFEESWRRERSQTDFDELNWVDNYR